MQTRMEGMRVRNVSRVTMVHSAELPPNPVTRNSFGFESVVLSWRGAYAKNVAVDREIPTRWPAPVPAPFGQDEALADPVAKHSMMQSVARMITELFKPVPPSALLYVWRSVSSPALSSASWENSSSPSTP